MRTLHAAHTSALANRTFSISAHAISIIPQNGVVKYITDAQTDLVIGGNTYKATAGVVRASIPVRINTGPTKMDVQFVATVGGYIDYDEVRDGVYDGAQIIINAIDINVPGNLSPIFYGELGNVQLSDRFHCTVECLGKLAKSKAYLLDRYSPNCRFWFGDPLTCKFDIMTVSWAATVFSASGREIITDGVPHADGFFNLGHIEMLDGLREGHMWEVREWDLSSQRILLYSDLEGGVLPGDTFNIFGGCSYILDDADHGCLSHNNVINFGGFNLPGNDIGGMTLVPVPPATITFGQTGESAATFTMVAGRVHVQALPVPQGVSVTGMAFKLDAPVTGGQKIRGGIWMYSPGKGFTIVGATNEYTTTGSEADGLAIGLTLGSPVMLAAGSTWYFGLDNDSGTVIKASGAAGPDEYSTGGRAGGYADGLPPVLGSTSSGGSGVAYHLTMTGTPA